MKEAVVVVVVVVCVWGGGCSRATALAAVSLPLQPTYIILPSTLIVVYAYTHSSIVLLLQ